MGILDSLSALFSGGNAPGRAPTPADALPPVTPEGQNTARSNLMQLLSGQGGVAPIARAIGGGMASLGNTGGDPYVAFGRGFGGATGYTQNKIDQDKKLAMVREQTDYDRSLDARKLSMAGAESSAEQKRWEQEMDLKKAIANKKDRLDYVDRADAAQALGLTPDDPAYKSYVLTGKMPREDQAPLTATDKKAILEADEMVQANSTAIDMLNSVVSGNPGETLNDKASYGATAGTQSWLARNDPTGFFNDEKGEATTELNNVVLGQALGQLKATFGAAPTEGERKILVDLQASVDKTPAERKAIIERAIDLAQRRLDFNQQRANELRDHTFYKPKGGPSADPGLSEASPGAPATGGVTSSGHQWSLEP